MWPCNALIFLDQESQNQVLLHEEVYLSLRLLFQGEKEKRKSQAAGAAFERMEPPWMPAALSERGVICCNTGSKRSKKHENKKTW